MYKYVKGITVLSEERMSNALEIAQEYHLWMPITDSLTPNGELIEFLVEAFIARNNYKISEYFYLEPYNVSFPVYPEKFIKAVMDDFLAFMESKGWVSSTEMVYSIGNKDKMISFMYYIEPKQARKIIGFEEFKKRKEGNDND